MNFFILFLKFIQISLRMTYVKIIRNTLKGAESKMYHIYFEVNSYR